MAYQEGNTEQKLRIILVNGPIHMSHGSILGPLLFNIYINVIFYFVNENCFANYADGNTPHAIDKSIEMVLNALKTTQAH